MTYTYDPGRIKGRGKDQMRFELGDTLAGGGAGTCALSDEEYGALLEGLGPGKAAWLRAKLEAVDAVLHKLSFEADVKIDGLSYAFGDRAERWGRLRGELAMGLQRLQAGLGAPSMAGGAWGGPPYFHAGMGGNGRALPPAG